MNRYERKEMMRRFEQARPAKGDAVYLPDRTVRYATYVSMHSQRETQGHGIVTHALLMRGGKHIEGYVQKLPNGRTIMLERIMGLGRVAWQYFTPGHFQYEGQK